MAKVWMPWEGAEGKEKDAAEGTGVEENKNEKTTAEPLPPGTIQACAEVSEHSGIRKRRRWVEAPRTAPGSRTGRHHSARVTRPLASKQRSERGVVRAARSSSWRSDWNLIWRARIEMREMRGIPGAAQRRKPIDEARLLPR